MARGMKNVILTEDMDLHDTMNAFIEVYGDRWHYSLLTSYAIKQDIRKIAECGANQGGSATAFLLGDIDSLVSYDLHPENVSYRHISKRKNPDTIWQVQKLNSVEEPIRDCDLLLLDTAHNPHHVTRELYLQSPQVSQVIIIHDTSMRNVEGAVMDFCRENPWTIAQWSLQGTGTMVIEREP